MKVSDIMLDLATGDASVHDAYIQEAMGQVKVSAAIYNAAKQIALLDDSERSQIVQEAADAGLPYDRENSIKLMYESVARELIGTSRHLYMEMAKLEETGSKPTAPLGAVNKLAQVCGVKQTMDGTPDYCAKLADAVVSKGDIDLKNAGKFLKASAAKKYTTNLIQGVALLCNAFCIDTKPLGEDSAIKAVVPALVSASAGKDEDGKDDCTVAYMSSVIKSGSKYVKDCEISESDYTESITKNDLATVITCNFAAVKLAKFVKKKLGNEGSSVEKRVNKALKKSYKSNQVSGSINELNEKGPQGKSNIVEFNENLWKLNKALIQGFNDSIYSLMNKKNEE